MIYVVNAGDPNSVWMFINILLSAYSQTLINSFDCVLMGQNYCNNKFGLVNFEVIREGTGRYILERLFVAGNLVENSIDKALMIAIDMAEYYEETEILIITQENEDFTGSYGNTKQKIRSVKRNMVPNSFAYPDTRVPEGIDIVSFTSLQDLNNRLLRLMPPKPLYYVKLVDRRLQPLYDEKIPVTSYSTDSSSSLKAAVRLLIDCLYGGNTQENSEPKPQEKRFHEYTPCPKLPDYYGQEHILQILRSYPESSMRKLIILGPTTVIELKKSPLAQVYRRLILNKSIAIAINTNSNKAQLRFVAVRHLTGRQFTLTQVATPNMVTSNEQFLKNIVFPRVEFIDKIPILTLVDINNRLFRMSRLERQLNEVSSCSTEDEDEVLECGGDVPDILSGPAYGNISEVPDYTLQSLIQKEMRHLVRIE